MQPLPARKTRPSLAVEPLEDRRLLSTMFTTGFGQGVYGRPIDTSVETGPVAGGPTNFEDADGFQGSGPDYGQMDPFRSSTDFDHQDSPMSADPASTGWTLVTMTAIYSPTNSMSASSSNSMPTWNLASSEPVVGPTVSAESTDSAGSDLARTSNVESIASVPGNVPASVPSAPASRAPAAFSSFRSASFSSPTPTPDTIQTTAHVEASPAAAPSGRSSADETLMAAASALPMPQDVASSPESARSVAVVNLPMGSALPGIQGRAGLTLTPSKAPADPAIVDESAITPGGVGVSTEIPSAGDALVESQPAGVITLPEPDLAGMIQSVLPFDRSAMEHAIDQFLEPLDDLASSMTGLELRGPMGLITASLAAAATVVAVEVAIRLRRAEEEKLSADDVEALASFPGL